MRKLFDTTFRVISTLLGCVMVLLGGVWILQGLNIAFLDSFMAGDITWTFWGILLALGGIGQVIWSNKRPT